MREGSVAKRYATALIKVAQDTGKVESLLTQLEALTENLFSLKDLQHALTSPLIKNSQKKAILKALSEKFQLDVHLVNFLHILIDNDRISALPMIVRLYRERTDEILGQVRVFVTSAAPLGEMESALKLNLEKALKQKVILQVEIDSELLGGFIVQVKDRVLDASLKRELEQLKDDIQSKAVA